MKAAMTAAIEKLIQLVKNALSLKYDKVGGDISGDVKIFGNLTLDIDDEDYDAGVRITKMLDNNAGTVVTLTGYADDTNYKPVIRNIASPINNYDAANKQYVDSQVVRPDSYLVFLNSDGTIDSYSSNLTYAKVKQELTSYSTVVYLDVIYGTSRIHIDAMQDMDTNNGPIVFMGPIRMLDGSVTEAVFLLDSNNNLTAHYTTRENAQFKTTNIAANYNNEVMYPTVKGVWDTFQRKPVTVWETDGTGLVGINSNMSATPSWQLTNLNLSPFKRVKIYTTAAQKSGTTASASTTPAVVLEMSLDERAAGPYGGHYIGTYMGQKPNDANRLFTVTCAISADKTSFVVLRMTTLYGTAATDNSDVNAYVYKIEGYYD